MNLGEQQIAVFVYPYKLDFYTASPSTHKQLLRVYNHYDVPVKFEASLNKESLYEVIERKGGINPRHNEDVAIRHKSPIPASCPSEENLKIILRDAFTNKFIGQRLIPLKLIPGENDQKIKSEPLTPSNQTIRNAAVGDASAVGGLDNLPMKLSVCAFFIVLFSILFIIPTKCEQNEETFIPSYLHIGVWPKMLISFILGLFISMYIKIL